MKSAPTGRNVAGIVPLTGKQSTFDFPWPDYLQPIRQGMLKGQYMSVPTLAATVSG